MCPLRLPESEAGQSERSWTHPGLGSLLRKELGLSSSDLFSMTVADYDMKPTVRNSCCYIIYKQNIFFCFSFLPLLFTCIFYPQRVFEAPPSSLALFEYIDNFSSRLPEKEKERRSPPACSDHKQQPEAENSLLRWTLLRMIHNHNTELFNLFCLFLLGSI